MLRPSIAGACAAVLCAAGVASVAFLGACSSDETGGSSGTTGDAAAAPDTGGSDAGGDAGGPVEVNACKTFQDQTGAGDARAITWGFPVATAPERCMKITKGQTVTWSGDFSSHPIAAQGGDKPNPIANFDDASGKVTFAAAGTFGFICTNHPAMIGAIQVVE